MDERNHLTDHDILIELRGKCDDIIDRLDKINGRINKTENDVVDIKLERQRLIGQYDKRVSELEGRPTAMKQLLILGSLMTAVQVILIFGKSLIGK